MGARKERVERRESEIGRWCKERERRRRESEIGRWVQGKREAKGGRAR